MRKLYLCLIVVGFIVVLVLITLSIYSSKTYYLNLSFYDTETTKDSNDSYNPKMPSCMEVIGIDLKNGEDEVSIITDSRVINLVIGYLNKLPLVPVDGYFDKSKRVFFIKELYKQGYDFIEGNKGKDVLLKFYNDSQIEIGDINIYNDKYIRDPNYRAYKVEDETMSMFCDIRNLLRQEMSVETR